MLLFILESTQRYEITSLLLPICTVVTELKGCASTAVEFWELFRILIASISSVTNKNCFSFLQVLATIKSKDLAHFLPVL
jgi:hypothetical protein